MPTLRLFPPKSSTPDLSQRLRIHVRDIEGFLKAVQNDPNPDIHQLAEHFRNLNHNNSPRIVDRVDPLNSMRIADAYEQMEHDPFHPDVQRSYNALKHQTLQQWNHLHANGYTAEPWAQAGQPYSNSADLMRDLGENKHLYFFPTLGPTGAYGEHGEEPTDHPMLEPAGIVRNGRHLVYNDLFRAVRDFYGHGANGYQFGPTGEENAWHKHKSMFSPEAVPALTSETRGQNSWVNFGRHLRAYGAVPKPGDPQWVHPANRPYAQQKAGLLPPEFYSEE